MTSHGRARTALTGAALAALLTTPAGCGLTGQDDATWQPAPGQALGDDTTAFTALVTRTGCNSGETGEVDDPDIDEGDEEVTITFTVSPVERDVSCPGNDAVPFEVQLSEPLGGRALIDGATGSPADGSDSLER